MRVRFNNIVCLAAILLTGYIFTFGQGADNRTSIFSKPEDESRKHPKSILESLEKMRIEKEKKEYGEMIARGVEVDAITEELEKSFEQNKRLTEKELEKLSSVEKLVKKIRTELGGDDDKESEKGFAEKKTMSIAEAVKGLRSATISLCDELKKTTRFSISAAAIHSSNSVLKIARFLRIAK